VVTARAIVDRLRAIDFIHSIERNENKLILQVENPEEENPKIVAILVKENYQVQFVGEIRHSLEEIYIKLVAPKEESQ
jgi:ABC-2 type transport system ATP-binding protein